MNSSCAPSGLLDETRGADDVLNGLVEVADAALARGFILEGITLAWNTASIAVLAISAVRARKLGNLVLQTEGRVTLVDALLAAAVLTGLLLNAAIGWWWADPLAGYVILVYGLKEGRAALRA